MRLLQKIWRWLRPQTSNVEMMLGISYLRCTICHADTRADRMRLNERGRCVCMDCYRGKK